MIRSTNQCLSGSLQNCSCVFGDSLVTGFLLCILCWLKDIFYRHPCMWVIGFGDDIGGKSNVGGLVPPRRIFALDNALMNRHCLWGLYVWYVKITLINWMCWKVQQMLTSTTKLIYFLNFDKKMKGKSDKNTIFNKWGLVKTYRNVLFLWTELAFSMNKNAISVFKLYF